MQTRVNSTRPSGKEVMSRINEDKPTFFGPPVSTKISEDHLQRLKIELQQKAKLREKQCAYFHDSCSRRAYCKRNEIKSVLCKMKLCTLRNKICPLRNEICTMWNENIYFAKWKSALFFYLLSILQCFLSWPSQTNGRVLRQPQPKAFLTVSWKCFCPYLMLSQMWQNIKVTKQIKSLNFQSSCLESVSICLFTKSYFLQLMFGSLRSTTRRSRKRLKIASSSLSIFFAIISVCVTFES